VNDESHLVARLKKGDTEAFDALYDRYRGRVFAFLVRLSGDRPRAEDLTQETFVHLARKARGLQADTRLRPWLFTVARNLFVDQRRRLRLDFDRLRDLALWPTQRRVPSPFERAELKQTQLQLEDALAELPAKYREVLLLICIENFDASEVATMLKLTPELVRKRLSRARSMLKDAIQ
jgi:RNA polymerase sigma-70 factor, ECF subfamily